MSDNQNTTDESSPKPDAQKLRNLKIKSGVVKRLCKDVETYLKECDMQKSKIEKYLSEGKDEYFMKQQYNCLKECEMMVPDCSRRIKPALDELKQIVEVEKETPIGKTGEYSEALKIIEAAKVYIDQ